MLLVRPDPDVFEEAGQLLGLIDGGSVVKNPPANTGDGVRSLGGEDPWRRAWQASAVFLSGESHGQRRLAGYSPWGLRVGHE